MTTEVILDPTEVAAAGRVELPIHTGPIQVGTGGIDWGDAVVDQYLADAQLGQLPVDYRIPNRRIVIPLVLGADGRHGFEAARALLQGKVALLQREGGWLKRGDGLYADIVGATLTLPDKWGHLGVEADVVLQLDAIPDFYGDEIEVASMSLSGPEGVVEIADVPGDHPARARIQVSSAATAHQRGLFGGIRGRHYSPDASAALAYAAEDMTPQNQATVAAQSGAFTGNVVRHNAVSTGWTPVLLTDLTDGGPLTHTGTYRIWVRARSSSSLLPQLRAVWDTGDLVVPEENDPVSLTVANVFQLLDLGTVRLDRAPIGQHLWRAQIQAITTSFPGNVMIDRVWLVPVDEGYFRLAAPGIATLGIAPFIARDDFSGAADNANLNGRAPQVGAAWATAGATTDFKLSGTSSSFDPFVVYPDTVYRDPASATLRRAVFGPSVDECRVTSSLRVANTSPNQYGSGDCGLIARFVDANNYLRFTARQFTPSSGGAYKLTVKITKVVAGVETVLATQDITTMPYALFMLGRIYMQLDVTDLGEITANVTNVPSGGSLAVTDADLATGGPLATGKAGIVDSGDGTHVVPRLYEDVLVTELPVPPAVIFRDRLLEMRSDGIYREDRDGDSFGIVPIRLGDLPRIPPASLEGRTSELLLKVTRGDLDQLPDTHADPLSVQVWVRPSWLFRPAP